MNNKIISFLLLISLLILIPVISAQPPVTQTQNFPNGYIIVESRQEYLAQNEPYQYNFFVYNASNGIMINNNSLDCYFFLADNNGEVIFNSEVDYFSDGHWGIDIDGGNFSNLGFHAYGVSCQDGFGGALSGVWEVTLNGKEPTDSIIVVFFSILLIGFMSFGILYFIKSLESVVNLDLDLMEMSVMVSTYLGFWMFYYLSFEYLGNPVINDLLEIALDVGAVTHVFIPLVCFMLSFIMTHLRAEKKSRVTY